MRLTRFGLLRRGAGGAFASAVLMAASLITSTPAHATTPSPQVALDWNAAAVAAVRNARTMDGVPAGGSPRAFYQPEAMLYMAYVQAAVYDATMKISHRYLLYHHFIARAGDASIEAAIDSAYYNSLVFYLGDPDGSLAARYAADIAALPDNAFTQRGIAVGLAAAQDLEQLRANDGRNAPISDACPTDTTPGVWRCTPPPSLQAEQTPWLATMEPFMLTGDSQFRAPAPPALGSSQYLADLQETKDFGAASSTVRTPAETAIAWFWLANVPSQLNQTMRGIAAQDSLDLVDTVRLLAAGDMVATDAAIGCWDSKYHWLRWRPITAIQLGSDFNDPTWTPLGTTPNHPEYPSAHGCVTSAMVRVMASITGTTNLNVTIPGATGGGTALTTSQVFVTEQDVDAQLVNARIWVGFHYRTSVLNGEALGQSVADWALQRFFLPGDDTQGD